jgi:hypothetical protein
MLVLSSGPTYTLHSLPQVQKRVQDLPKVISGSVVLAKHPVSHRGDVRVVKAVDLGPHSPLADAYVNVVVFSQQGKRPLPNMLAGSDLVGKPENSQLGQCA